MAGIDAFGTQFKRSDMAGSPTFTAIANVTNITPPELTRETLDMSAHDSPQQYREFRGGFKDAGEVSLELNYNPEVHDLYVADFEDEEPRDYQVVFPGGLGTWEFKAILTKLGTSAPMDDKLSGEFTFKASGPVDIT